MIGPIHVDPREWVPLGAEQSTEPPHVGDLFADLHAVWHVDRVENPSQLLPADMPAWAAAGRPDPSDPGAWDGWPYTVHATWAGGRNIVAPTLATRVNAVRRIPARGAAQFTVWYCYPTGRWPCCSCCGEPMPCRAEMAERQFAAELAAL